MGDASSNCKTYLGKYSSFNDMWLGDGDLNVMILDGCQSVHKCVWQENAYYAVGGNFTALLGFHGNSYDSLYHKNQFEDFVDSSRYDGIGDNWVDEMTRWWGFDSDECGTAVTYGSTAADRDFVYNAGGLEDWKTATSHSSSTFYYISNCNPDNGPKL